jgi:ADP-heptose:LPS heptosyltransferase
MRMLVILPGAIGDFILTLPALLWLKHKFQPDRLEIWLERTNLSLLPSLAYIHQGVALADTPVDRWPPSQTLFNQLQKFDLVISWRGSEHQEWVDSLQAHHSNLHFLSSFSKNYYLHATEFRKMQLASLFGDIADYPSFPEVSPPAESLRSAHEILQGWAEPGRKLVMVHPGASGMRKLWPAGHFAELNLYLLEHHYQVLICEGPQDSQVVRSVLEAIPDQEAARHIRIIRLDDLTLLASVMKLCHVYIGNDSGITHLAAASGINTLCLFTTTDPVLWAPRGPRASYLVDPSVENVLNTVAGMIHPALEG